MAWFTTACPRNCYSTCSMRVRVEGGRLLEIQSHPDGAATAGGPCIKGQSYIERVVSPKRLLHPLVRTVSGGFEPITWDAALDRIAEELSRTRDGVGPQGLLYYASSGTKGLLNSVGPSFFRLFGGYTTTYGDLCWPAGLEATRLTLGDNRHSAPSDITKARLILLWGKNPAETNIHQMPFIDQALEAGARLIVIDPRRTESSERADLLIQPRPGSDGALALAVAHCLIRDGRVDHRFIDQHVHGFEAFAEGVQATSPRWAAEITGVEARYIERLSELVGSVTPMTLCAGFGMQRYTNSGQTMRALLALPAITGNLGKPGAGWVYANLQSAVFDAVKDPIAFYPPDEPDGVVRVGLSTSKLGKDMLSMTDPPLEMAWVERGNPLAQNPESPTVREAFRRLRFRVVVDQFLTDSAREADIVLPAKTFLEQSDIIGAYWHSYVQLKQKVLEPPGEVRPETEIYRALAVRMGMDRRAVDFAIPGPGDEEVEAWLERRLDPWPDLSLDRLREGPVAAPGSDQVAWHDLVFPTPSGRIELQSEEAARRWGVAALPDFHPPEESALDTRGRSAPFPLQMMTPNTKDRIHSQFGNLEMVGAGAPEPRLVISPADALPRGIREADEVRVFNDRGELRLPVTLDFGLRAGCVVCFNGYWHSEGAGVNVLSKGRETDMAHGAAFHDTLVEVERCL
ncbi:MAG: molybdopterin-dependent oxidoreductase [Acidobacteria bacterium]|nr:molybdopterin-dependent oxidoreductase [Acidobacteriota bacterium]